MHKIPLITRAIVLKKDKAIEVLLEQPNIDINNKGGTTVIPFSLALHKNFDVKIIKLFYSHPKFNQNDSFLGSSAIDICINQNNFYAFEYLINIYSDIVKENFMSICSKSRGVILKTLLKWKLKNSTKDEIIDEIKYASADVHENVLKALGEFK